MPVRARLVVANWKMNKTPREAADWAGELLSLLPGLPEGVDLAAAPAFPALERVGRMLQPTRAALAAQDVYTEPKGAFTGEVSAAMLADLGVALAIVGHSERRREREESETEFSRKMKRLEESRIAPIYCVGETLEERDAGVTERVLTAQLAALDLFPQPPPGLVLAYEPVWAIGTGRSATPQMAEEAHRFLRGLLAERYGTELAEEIRILYGGSVTPANARDLFRSSQIDGGLVGGASLVAKDFAAIAAAAS